MIDKFTTDELIVEIIRKLVTLDISNDKESLEVINCVMDDCISCGGKKIQIELNLKMTHEYNGNLNTMVTKHWFDFDNENTELDGQMNLFEENNRKDDE